VVALLLLPGAIAAQIAPDTPRMMSPNGPGGFGVAYVRAGVLPGDEEAVLVTWTLPGSSSLRVRGGLGYGNETEEAGFVGFDLQAPIARRGQIPFDLDWQGGAGVGFGGHLLVTVPVGITAGRSWSSGSVWMAPYASVGIAADLHLGDEFEGEQFQVHPALDVGLDLALDQARHTVVRVAASLGDRQALSVGLAIGGGARTRR
jgi:hypothetical protein